MFSLAAIEAQSEHDRIGDVFWRGGRQNANKTLLPNKTTNALESIVSSRGSARSDNPMNDYDTVALATINTTPEELAAFFEAQLSRPLSDVVVRKLFAFERGLRKRQTDLVNQLENHEISREQYLKEFNAALALLMEQSRSLLGERDFALAYGEAGAHPQSLDDPEIFLASH